ncbi:MAG: hypothetical protein ACXWUP_10570 [Allosphingosinicella sp.]
MNVRRVLTAPGLAASPPALLRTAIRKRTCVQATYNRLTIRLAPHALYTRHDEYYVDGVVLERDGQPPREARLGTFKVDGLRELALAAAPFVPETQFDPGSPKYDEGAILVASD